MNAIVALRERAELLSAGGKDLEPVKGMKTSLGFAPLRDFVAPADSIMVERMRRAGGIFIGRTNTPEFGLGNFWILQPSCSPSTSSSTGRTRSPATRWRPITSG